MLQHGVAPGELAYEDMMAISYQVAFHKGSGGSGHGEGGRMVVPNLPCESDLDTVHDLSGINPGSSVNNGASQASPHLRSSEVVL